MILKVGFALYINHYNEANKTMGKNHRKKHKNSQKHGKYFHHSMKSRHGLKQYL